MRATLLLLAACAAPAPPPIAHHVTQPPAPTSPAPTVAFVDGRVTTTGLPAVSADGTAIVLAFSVTDPVLGRPGLALQIRDRLDRETGVKYVLGFDDADEPPAATAARFVDANHWLVARHEAWHLVPMRTLSVTSLDEASFHHRATGDGIVVDWQPSQLAISRGGAAPFTHATPSTWLVADRPMYAGAADLCSFPAFLQAADIDTDRRVAVLSIAYMGTDTCPEPPPQPHVVHW